ncbi:MAG: hypothetical protein HYS13_11245 [Planctomycetia bacterium]|nr:hypothetical protein [Planctomycetia bacterium]
MNRIFPVLALVAAAFLVAAMIVGLNVDVATRSVGIDALAPGVSASSAQQPRDDQVFRLHFLLGVASGIVVMLVHGIAVTYFIGTSRWCKEVVAAYSLDPELAKRSARLKRRTFPLALFCMLVVVAIAALGAAEDTRVPEVLDIAWSDLHYVAAFAGLALMLAANYFQWLAMCDNQRVIEEIAAEVKRVRHERGLDD